MTPTAIQQLQADLLRHAESIDRTIEDGKAKGTPWQKLEPFMEIAALLRQSARLTLLYESMQRESTLLRIDVKLAKEAAHHWAQEAHTYSVLQQLALHPPTPQETELQTKMLDARLALKTTGSIQEQAAAFEKLQALIAELY